MMPTEEDLRATFRDLASQAPDTDAVLTTLRAREASRRPGWPRFAAAIAAAAAVCLVIGLAVAISGGGQTRHPAANSSLLDRLPRYYMVLLAKGSSATYEAVIRDTVTGKVLATVRPPAPFTTFSLPAAAPNDRTFVLAAERQKDNKLLSARLYRAQFSPARGSVRLSPLPIPEFPASEPLTWLTLSPSGTELAVALYTIHSNRVEHTQIRIYSLTGHPAAGRLVRVWTGPDNTDTSPLSWARTGMLAFNWEANTPSTYRLQAKEDGVYLLNTDAPSGSLLGDGRLVLKTFAKRLILGAGLLTADGKTIVAIDVSTGISPEVKEFSATTGKLTRVIGPVHWPPGTEAAEAEGLAWANPSGSVVVKQVAYVSGKIGWRWELYAGAVNHRAFERIGMFSLGVLLGSTAAF